MKFIKKFNESVEDTKNWIYNIMDTCKDIMIDLEDIGMETEVEKSLQPDKSILIECLIKSNKRWKKDVILDSKRRLVYYMESEGFELIREVDDIFKIEYIISFKKSDIDNDYISHLRYLKRYNIKENFENKYTTQEEIEWIEDSLLELTDDNFICKVSSLTNNIGLTNYKGYVYYRKNENSATSVFNIKKSINGLESLDIISNEINATNKNIIKYVKFMQY